MKSRFLTVRDDCLTEVTLLSGSSEVTFVQVQVLLSAPKQKAVRKAYRFLFGGNQKTGLEWER